MCKAAFLGPLMRESCFLSRDMVLQLHTEVHRHHAQCRASRNSRPHTVFLTVIEPQLTIASNTVHGQGCTFWAWRLLSGHSVIVGYLFRYCQSWFLSLWNGWLCKDNTEVRGHSENREHMQREHTELRSPKRKFSVKAGFRRKGQEMPGLNKTVNNCFLQHWSLQYSCSF